MSKLHSEKLKEKVLEKKQMLAAGLALCAGAVFLVTLMAMNPFLLRYEADAASAAKKDAGGDSPGLRPMTPTEMLAYDQKMRELAHLTSVTPSPLAIASSSEALAVQKVTASRAPRQGVRAALWPADTVYPDAGALLPFHRIVAYYGNFYSKQMGVLGEYPPAQVLAMLASTSALWQAADPSTPVIPAIDYIAVAAQAAPGRSGTYRARMPDDQIEKALGLAAEVHGIVVLDIQVGLSNPETEVPLLEQFLKLPNVELALDPEFAMHNGARPGSVIGSLDAKDINFAATYLAGLVKKYNLPPKLLIVHRFTEDMVTNYQNIEPLPEVEIVMDMDGWGYPQEKITTYTDFIKDEPVQFTGLKLFYKNDLRPPSTRLLTPQEILKLTPSPSFIQYQ